jgi:hypothetical protein
LNKGTVPCLIAFTLIGAKPFTVHRSPFTMGGKKGDAVG